METIPGKYSSWEVTKGQLPEALNELRAQDIELKDVKIVPLKIKVVDELFNATEFDVTSYMLLYYSLPVLPLGGPEADGTPATIQ